MEAYKSALEKGRENYAKVKAEKDALRKELLQFGEVYKDESCDVNYAFQLVTAAGHVILTTMSYHPKIGREGASIYPCEVVHNDSQVRVRVRDAGELELRLADFFEHPSVVERIIEREAYARMK